MQPIRYQARDGREIPGYLVTPKGVAAEKLPTVIVPHGGPWGRDSWGYNSIAQFLANRGYAVMMPNFRGSTGYGKQFLNEGNGEWGTGIMQHDITDGVQYLIDEGIADPEQVAIMGGSYGGYATLAGVTFTPTSTPLACPSSDRPTSSRCSTRSRRTGAPSSRCSCAAWATRTTLMIALASCRSRRSSTPRTSRRRS